MKPIKYPTGIEDRSTLRDRIVERECKKPGFKAKIRAFCCHCIYDPYSDGTWLKQVENCTSSHCPLFTVRPVPSSNKEASGNG
jgi:hypothetical protein